MDAIIKLFAPEPDLWRTVANPTKTTRPTDAPAKQSPRRPGAQRMVTGKLRNAIGIANNINCIRWIAPTYFGVSRGTTHGSGSQPIATTGSEPSIESAAGFRTTRTQSSTRPERPYCSHTLTFTT